MVPKYCRCLIHLGFLPHYSPTPPLKKVSASPHISSKATWLCLLGFIGELGKGAEGEKVKKDGLSHKGWNCPGPKNSSPVCYQLSPGPDPSSSPGLGVIPPEENVLCPAGVTLNESCGPHFWKPSHFKPRTKLCFTWALASQKQMEKKNSKITPSEETV